MTYRLRLRLLAAFAAAACWPVAGALAQQTTAQQTTAEQLPLWEVGAIGGLLSTPAYPAADERSTRALALPYLIYRGEVLRADASGIGARLFHSEAIELDLGFAASLPARSDQVAARRGMPDLGTLVEFGPRLKIGLARPSPGSQLKLELPLRAVIEAHAGVRTQGIAFEPRLVYEARELYRGWGGSVSLSSVFGNDHLQQYFYTVAPPYATAERPAYEAKQGLLLTRLSLLAGRDLNRDWRLYAFARYDNYRGAANRNSPLFKKNSGTSFGLALAWTFARAQLAGK